MTNTLQCTPANVPSFRRGNAGRGGASRKTWRRPGQAAALHVVRARALGPRRAAAGTSPGSGRPRGRTLRLGRREPPAIPEAQKSHIATAARRQERPHGPPTMLFYSWEDPLSAGRGESGLYHRPPRSGGAAVWREGEVPSDWPWGRGGRGPGREVPPPLPPFLCVPGSFGG